MLHTKKGFSEIINFYKNFYSRIKFFEILISDTFGYNDNREKLAVVLKKIIKIINLVKLYQKIYF